MEPCDFGAFGGCPDAVVALLQERITLEDEPFGNEFFDGDADVLDLPAEDGIRRWSEALNANEANHGAVGIQHNGEGIVADELQTEDCLIEVEGAFCILCWDEAYDSASGNHMC